MNRLQDLKKKNSKIAVIGLNTEGMRYAMDFASRFDTLVFDEQLDAGWTADDILLNQDWSKKKIKNEFILGHSENDLLSAGVYYLNGLSSSLMDWDSIKRGATLIGKCLSPGDWIVLGPHIDPDLAEVVLLEIIERNSGLKMGEGFELAFHPLVITEHNFTNMSNEMKMSHNLIVGQVEQIFNLRQQGQFQTSQINYQNLETEMTRIRNKVKELWIPMLNDMTSETFQEFVDLSINNGFLDVYGHLRLSNESHVNWRRFFQMVQQFGIKQELQDLLNFQQKKLKAI